MAVPRVAGVADMLFRFQKGRAVIMINGEMLKQAIISGAHNISAQKNHINDLNIFPVPDGDTGTNMSMTVMAAAKALEEYDGTNAGEVAEIAAKAMPTYSMPRSEASPS